MRRISAWILALAVLVGAAGSAVAYAHVGRPLPPAPGAPAATAASAGRHVGDAARRVARPVTKVRWAPCAPTAHLEHGVCVVDVVHTVVLPAPRTPQPAAASSPAPAPAAARPAARAGGTTATATVPAGGRAGATTEREDGRTGGEDGERAQARHVAHDD